MYNPYAMASDASLGQQNLHHPRPQHVVPQGTIPPSKQEFQGQYHPQSQYSQQQTYGQYMQQGDQYQQQYQKYQGQTQQHQQQHQHQHQQHQQQQQHQSIGAPYGEFFNDPATAVAAQFAKSSFGQSNSYFQQNFGSYMPVVGDLKYYFRVSNGYVWRKLVLVLFPYRHCDWSRIQAVESGVGGTVGTGGTGMPFFAPASEDINAPDLYIPLMAFVTYILLWAFFGGLRGDFHPQVFGSLASQTLACSFLDILIFKVGLYLLNCSAQTSFWDLISFSGYKYVSVIVLLCWKQVVPNSWVAYYSVLLVVVGSLSLFLMRSLKFLILPYGAGENASASISNGQRRLRVQFLFIYSFLVQFSLVIYMSR